MITQKDRDEIEAIAQASETKQIMNDSTKINPGEGYRLLNIGEELEPSDEFWQPGEGWIMRGQGAARRPMDKHHYCHRRRLETKPAVQWIPISERNPEFPCVMYSPKLGFELGIDYTWWEADRRAKEFTHWHPLPPDPKPDDEAAFHTYWRNTNDVDNSINADIAKRAFLAGLALGRKEK